MKEELFLTRKDENGMDMKCRIILSFTWQEKNSNYIVYTDDKKDEEGNLELYAIKYNLNNPSKIQNIETEEEWNVIEKMLDNVEGEK